MLCISEMCWQNVAIVMHESWFLEFCQRSECSSAKREDANVQIDRTWCREAFTGTELAGVETQSKLCKEVKLSI